MRVLLLVLVLAGCRRGPVLPTDGGVAETLRTCPTSGAGAMEGEHCFVLSPAETGLLADGENAMVEQYALRPASGARGQLMVFFNGSGGSPRAGTGTSTASWYGVSRGAGYHVFAVSYASDESIGSLCRMNDACFEPTRLAMLTGTAQAGAAAPVADLRADEGAEARVLAGLRLLVALDPQGGWDAFVDGDQVRWEKVVTAGHSQGAGHAALVAKRRTVARAIMLAGPCDQVNGAAASWMKRDASFATPAERFFGLGVDGDMTCPTFATNWDALQVPMAQQLKGSACVAADAHGAPLSCANNAGLWRQMLE
jgi:hypothetical protein